MAASLMGRPVSFVNADVALDGEPVVGSFTVDGLTFAVAEGSNVELVGVRAGAADVVLPESVSFEDIDYALTSIAPYAFYLSGVTSVELPASITDVDERAFRSSDVSSVEVDPSSEAYASFDGILYDADLTCLLLIPGGRTGAARISSKAEEVDAAAFSHCAGVTAISVDAGSDHLSSWEGLLYDASDTTLLRVPAGATDITIRDGCTSIAAGALEGCAQLTTINAPASVASISPDVFTSVPTVSLPAVSVADDGAEDEAGASPRRVVASSQGLEAPLALPDLGSAPASPSTEASDSKTPQLTALVALSSTDDDLPEVDPAAIMVALSDGSNSAPWEAVGFTLAEVGPEATLQDEASYRAFDLQLSANGGRMTSTQYPGQSFTTGQTYNSGDSITFNSNGVITYSGFTITYSNPGCTFNCYSLANSYTGSSTRWTSGTRTMTTNAYLIWNVPITWNANGGYWNGNPSDTANKSNTWTSRTAAKGYGGSMIPQRTGYRFTGWRNSSTGAIVASGSNVPVLTATTYVAQWASDYTIHFDGNVVDDDAHPATVPADTTAARDTPMVLPAPTRFGYIFKGWATHPYGSTANGNQVFAPGETAVNLTDTPGDTVTLYALWALKYDADVPICVPTDMTFALDATGTGAIKAVPADYTGDYSPSDMDALGSTHAAAIESRMAVPVEVESVSAEAIDEGSFAKVLSSTDGSPAEDQLAFTVASGDASVSVKAGQSASLSGLLVPEATEGEPVAKLSLDYGLQLADTAVVLTSEEGASVPVAKVSYTLDMIDGMASKWGFFMLDGGTPVTPTRIKQAADDIAEAAYAGDVSASGYYEAFKEALDGATPFYLRVDDQPDGWFSVHEMNILGIAQDTLTTARTNDAGATIATKAGLTFGFKDIYAYGTTGADGTFDCRMLPLASTRNWEGTKVRATLNGSFYDALDGRLTSEETGLVSVRKCSQRYYTMGAGLVWTDDKVFIPNGYEVFGVTSDGRNNDETAATSFRYMFFAQHGVSMLDYEGEKCIWWLRSSFYSQANSTGFLVVGSYSTRPDNTGNNSAIFGIVPCFAI